MSDPNHPCVKQRCWNTSNLCPAFIPSTGFCSNLGHRNILPLWRCSLTLILPAWSGITFLGFFFPLVPKNVSLFPGDVPNPRPRPRWRDREVSVVMIMGGDSCCLWFLGAVLKSAAIHPLRNIGSVSRARHWVNSDSTADSPQCRG